jgi:hypothetical protein
MNYIGSFSKVLEKLKFNRLNSFVQKYNILTDAQNGFRGGRSIETASQAFRSGLNEASREVRQVNK